MRVLSLAPFPFQRQSVEVKYGISFPSALVLLSLIAISQPLAAQVWLPNDPIYKLDRNPVPRPAADPDITLVASKAFALPSRGNTTVRNFVIPTASLGKARHISAVELDPGFEGIVRQGWIRFDSTSDSQVEDEKDREVGFPWHPQLGSLRQGDSLFAIWTPQSSVCEAPLGAAWRLHHHGDMVVTLILEPDGKRHDVQPKVNLWLAEPKSTPSVRTLVAETDPEGEIIVPLDVEGGQGPEVVTLRMANETIDIKPGAQDYSIRDSFVLRVPAQVTGIFPNANQHATKIRVDAVLPDNSTVRIFEINEWQWAKQDFYRFEQPLALPEGTRLETHIRYRNIAPNVGMAAKRVRWGKTLDDEMGEAWIQMVVNSERHAVIMSQRIAEHQLKLAVEAWEDHFNGDPEAHTALAFLYADLGVYENAVNHGRKAVETADKNNGSPTMAYTALGAALITKQAHYSAQEALEKAIDLDPDNGLAWHNLGQVYLFYGSEEKALECFVQAEMYLPRDYRVLNNLGLTHLQKEEYRIARENFEKILEIYPRHAKATANLGLIMELLEDKEEAVNLYRRALMLSPEMVTVLGPKVQALSAPPAVE